MSKIRVLSAGLLLLAALGCKTTPANPIVGTWTLSSDGTPNGTCAAIPKWIFTGNTHEAFNGEGKSGGPQLTQYVLELPNIFATDGTAVNAMSFTMGADDTLIWHAVYGPCTYKRS